MITGLVTAKSSLFAADAARDVAICGRSLATADAARTDLAASGAHDPTPTPYFVLDELLGTLDLKPTDHLLDVGCGTGRVLAYAAANLPCRVTGVELDPELASIAAAWTARSDRLEVRAASVLDIPLAPYTNCYLFNPFDTSVLNRFLDKLERDATRPVTLVHMSDNGESFAYLGRSGWERLREGSIQTYRTPQGANITVYDHPQHYTVWRFNA